MKLLSSLLPLGLALGVASNPLNVATRDIAVFEKFLTEIHQGVLKLGEIIDAYTGGPGTDIIESNKELVAMLYAGAETALGEPMLTQTESFGLAGFIANILQDIPGPINLLIERKDLAIENGIAYTVKTSLDDQYAASTELADAISARVDPAVKPVAEAVKAELLAAIQKGIDAYADVEPPVSSSTTPPDTSSTVPPTVTNTHPPTVTNTYPPSSTDASPTDSVPTYPGSPPPSYPTNTYEPSPTGDDPCECDHTDYPTETAGPTYPTKSGEPTYPTGTGVPPEPTGSYPVNPTNSYTVPEPTPTPSGPPEFPGAGAMNRVGGMSLVAALLVAVVI
ncbi:hypothetical protein FQN50_008866 [Emmonsiellopsis sp. PD_5]|nr:hypothetical protein FQN50_008866 [Emmonsiellopsis sp. PD_5]